jgi:hypothetical protein
MLKNMLNLPSPTPRIDLMKAFDKKFQIPKLSARAKTEEKVSNDDLIHPRSAPTTPSHTMAPSPTLDYNNKDIIFNQHPKFFSNLQQNQSSQHQQQQQQQQQQFQHHHKIVEQQKQKKLFKSASSEHLYENQSGNQAHVTGLAQLDDNEFQAFLRAQAKSSSVNDMNKFTINQQHMDGMQSNNNQQMSSSNLFNDDGLNLDFISNDI